MKASGLPLAACWSRVVAPVIPLYSLQENTFVAVGVDISSTVIGEPGNGLQRWFQGSRVPEADAHEQTLSGGQTYPNEALFCFFQWLLRAQTV